MTTTEIGNLVISGSGKATGGTFDLVKINGSGKVTGSIICSEFKCNGSSDIQGNIQAKLTRVNGSSNIQGNVESDDVKISGSAEIHGNVISKSIRINGSADILGQLATERVEIHGSASVREDVEAEHFSAKGGFEIGGLLNAGFIDITLYGNCRTKDIGGERIHIRKGGLAFGLRNILRSLFQFEMGLVTDTIEGDEIHLEYTQARVVRGKNVTIGPGCDIQLVEYTDQFHQAKGSKVKDSKKV